MSEQPTESLDQTGIGLDQVGERAKCLIASGRLKAATVDLLKLGRPQGAPHTVAISEALTAQRARLRK